MRKFQWLNESGIKEEGNRLTLKAPARTDIFNFGMKLGADGIPEDSVHNAPFYYTLVKGDFVLKARVSLKFVSDYDAGALLFMQDLKTWVKLAFEQTDFGTRAVVSVVTRVHSDDANGCNVEGETVWLQMARAGDHFALHYSLDGERYDMVRVFRLKAARTLKVGLLAQSPLGEDGERVFEHVSLEERTIGNLRSGV